MVQRISKNDVQEYHEEQQCKNISTMVPRFADRGSPISHGLCILILLYNPFFGLLGGPTPIQTEHSRAWQERPSIPLDRRSDDKYERIHSDTAEESAASE
jgi:hypothetical protein